MVYTLEPTKTLSPSQIVISLISMPVLCSLYGAFGILVSLAISYLSGFLVQSIL